ncbi:polyprenol phosphomannose-dependent alpha 1,6 mannosyltransferase MptB [Kineosporia succinea]
MLLELGYETTAVHDTTRREAPVRRWLVMAATGCAATTVLTLATSGLLPGPTLTTAVSVVAMGLLVLAWLGLGRDLQHLTTRRLYAITAAWSVPLLAARPLFSNDVWSYVAQGLTAARGLDPYRLGPAQALDPSSEVVGHVSHYWLDTPAPYGPAWMLLSRLAGLVAGENLVLSVVLYRLLVVAGVVLIAWSLPFLARRSGTAAGTALWLGLANPLVLWHLVAGVHNDALMLGLMLAGMRLVLTGLETRPAHGRLAAGAGMITLAASVKIVAAAALLGLCLVAVRRCARPVPAIALMVSVFAAVTVILSALTGFGWVTAPFTATTSVYSWMSPTTLTGLLVGFFHSGLTASAVSAANLLGLIIATPVVIRLLLGLRDGMDPVRGIGLLFVVTLLASPVVQPWYLLWALLPLAASAAGDRAARPLVIFSAVTAMVLPPFVTGGVSLGIGYAAAVLALGAGLWMLRRTGRLLVLQTA